MINKIFISAVLTLAFALFVMPVASALVLEDFENISDWNKECGSLYGQCDVLNSFYQTNDSLSGNYSMTLSSPAYAGCWAGKLGKVFSQPVNLVNYSYISFYAKKGNQTYGSQGPSIALTLIDSQNNSYIYGSYNMCGGITATSAQWQLFKYDLPNSMSDISHIQIDFYGTGVFSPQDILIDQLELKQNLPPVLNLIGNKSVDIMKNLSFVISASDPDNEIVTYSAQNLPAGAVFNPAARTFSWTPNQTQNGNYAVTFTASDGRLSASETINIAVLRGKDLIINSINLIPKFPNAGENVSFNITFSNIGDEDINEDFTFFMGVESTGISVSNIGHLKANSSKSIFLEKIYRFSSLGIIPLNAAIDANNGINESNESNNGFTKNVTVENATKYDVIEDFEDISDWNKECGSLYGQCNVLRSFSNSIDAAFDNYSMTLSSPAYAGCWAGKLGKVFSQPVNLANYSYISFYAKKGSSVYGNYDPSIAITLLDSQGNYYVYGSYYSCGGITISNSEWKKYTFDLPATISNISHIQIDFYSSGRGSTSAADLLIDQFELKKNNAPVLNSIGNKKLYATQNLSFIISASDPDNDTLTYSASNLPNGSSFNPAARTFSWTPNQTQNGNYAVTFTASDGRLSASQTVNIAVDPLNYIIFSNYSVLEDFENILDWDNDWGHLNSFYKTNDAAAGNFSMTLSSSAKYGCWTGKVRKYLTLPVNLANYSYISFYAKKGSSVYGNYDPSIAITLTDSQGNSYVYGNYAGCGGITISNPQWQQYKFDLPKTILNISRINIDLYSSGWGSTSPADLLIDQLELNQIPPCTVNWTSAFTGWSSCSANNAKTRMLYYYDTSSCNQTNPYQNETETATCDYCTSAWQNTNSSCRSDNTFAIGYAYTNTCCKTTGLSSDCNIPSNTTSNCDFCSPAWSCSSYGNCQSNNKKYCNAVSDSKNCYAQTGLNSDKYSGDYSEFAQNCDYCTVNLVNTSWSKWANISSCYSNNTLDQSRSHVQYDANNCGKINNQTFYEYQSIACGPSCSDECSALQKQCSGNGWQVCGDYDSDSCLEWSSASACAGNQLCNNGECINQSIACSSSSDCGTNGLTGNFFCSNGNVAQNYRAYSCLNSGTINSLCGYSDSDQTNQNCGSSYCDVWGNSYCSGANVIHDRACYDKGCSDSQCFSNQRTETETVQACSAGYSCISNKCCKQTLYGPICY